MAPTSVATTPRQRALSFIRVLFFGTTTLAAGAARDPPSPTAGPSIGKWKRSRVAERFTSRLEISSVEAQNSDSGQDEEHQHDHRATVPTGRTGHDLLDRTGQHHATRGRD